jgi:hypothetical protein
MEQDLRVELQELADEFARLAQAAAGIAAGGTIGASTSITVAFCSDLWTGDVARFGDCGWWVLRSRLLRISGPPRCGR